MQFKVEIMIENGRIVKERIYADNLTILHEILEEKYPKCKIVSILGG